MRLIAIIFSTLAVVLISLGIVYFWGVGQIHPKYDHPFFNSKRPWLILPEELKAQLGAKVPGDTVALIKVFRDAQGTLVIGAKDSAKTLVSQLGGSQPQRWILDIQDNVNDIDRQVAEIIKPFLSKQSILIQSEFDVVLRASKETLPIVPYGASQSDRMRMQTFQGMAPWTGGLIPAAPFKGDVFISPLKWKSVQLVDPIVVGEMHRRQKSVILGPLQNIEELNTAQSLAPDGYYIVNLDLLTNWNSLSGAQPVTDGAAVAH